METNLDGVVVMSKELRTFYLNQYTDALRHFRKLAMTELLLKQLLPNPDQRQNWINEVRMKFKCSIQERNNTLYFRM